MEAVYLLNGSESGGGGGSGTVVPARYRIIDKEVEEECKIENVKCKIGCVE